MAVKVDGYCLVLHDIDIYRLCRKVAKVANATGKLGVGPDPDAPQKPTYVASA